MPMKHLTAPQTWEQFFAILNTPISVTNTQGDSVTFTTTRANLDKINHLLSSQAEIKAHIPHLTKPVQEQLAAAAATLPKERAQDPLLQQILQLTDEQVISKLFPDNTLQAKIVNDWSREILESGSVKFTEPQHMIQPKRGKLLLEAAKAPLKVVQSNFNDIKSLIRFLSNEEEGCDISASEITPFAESIFKIQTEVNGAISVVFNCGQMRQELQQWKDSEYTTPPVIAVTEASAAEDIITCTVKKGQMIGYLSEVLNEGHGPSVIFSENLNDGKTQAAIFAKPATIQEDTVPIIHLLLDASGSMRENREAPESEYDAPEYKKRIMDIIRNIHKNNEVFKLSITTFSSELNNQQFTKQSQIEDIQGFVDSIKIGGGTNLRGALHEAITTTKDSLASHPFSTIIAITDGKHYYDETKVPSQGDLIHDASTLKDNNISIFAVGCGAEYEKPFFDELAGSGGFTHVKIDDVDQMKQLHQYTEQLGASVFMVEFITEVAADLGRVRAGEVRIVEVDGQVKVAKYQGMTFGIGVEEAPAASVAAHDDAAAAAVADQNADELKEADKGVDATPTQDSPPAAESPQTLVSSIPESAAAALATPAPDQGQPVALEEVYVMVPAGGTEPTATLTANNSSINGGAVVKDDAGGSLSAMLVGGSNNHDAAASAEPPILGQTDIQNSAATAPAKQHWFDNLSCVIS